MLSRLLLALVAASAATALEITAPNSETWWVAKSQNVFQWSCRSADAPQEFTVLIGNKDTSRYASVQAIVAIQANADCSHVLTTQQVDFPAGTDYYLQLANTLNSSDVYAESQPFEIKALGSAYPTTTTALEPTGSTDGDSNSSGSASGSEAQSTGEPDGASKSAVGLGIGAIAAILGLMTF